MSTGLTPSGAAHAGYWDGLTQDYQSQTTISLSDFHYGPLLPGDNQLQLLPSPLEGLRCLELGCGAGQNSIVLTKKGADCTALDVSQEMLNFGKALAKREEATCRFLAGDMDVLPPFSEVSEHKAATGGSGFDLIHSAYGIPFSSDPQGLLRQCADLLNPGGVLLFSMGHPIYAGEWLELDEEQGLFIQDYFHPTPDAREGDTTEALSRAYPISEVAEWIVQAGLTIDRILEPAALPEEKADQAPYRSEAWEAQRSELRKFPIVAIYRASK